MWHMLPSPTASLGARTRKGLIILLENPARSAGSGWEGAGLRTGRIGKSGGMIRAGAEAGENIRSAAVRVGRIEEYCGSRSCLAVPPEYTGGARLTNVAARGWIKMIGGFRSGAFPRTSDD